MEHEMIDQYNLRGEKINVIDKAEAHKLGLWHKAIHVWVVNDNNEILLQYRCKDKSFYPNTWDCSFAGHIGTGESSLETVLREGKEELGIDISNILKCCKGKRPNAGGYVWKDFEDIAKTTV